MSKHWVKLGNIKVPPISSRVLALPKVLYGTTTDHAEYWISSTTTPMLLLTNGSALEYAQAIEQIKFKYLDTPTLLSLSTTGPWHKDKSRACAVNIALQNGSLARTEFEDGSGYVMQDGDVYCLDTTITHRVVFEHDATAPRIVLSISLRSGFDTADTQNIIKDINEQLSK